MSLLVDNKVRFSKNLSIHMNLVFVGIYNMFVLTWLIF